MGLGLTVILVVLVVLAVIGAVGYLLDASAEPQDSQPARTGAET